MKQKKILNSHTVKWGSFCHIDKYARYIVYEDTDDVNEDTDDANEDTDDVFALKTKRLDLIIKIILFFSKVFYIYVFICL